MAFDPSVISQIGPSSVPDFAGAQKSAYQLKDMMQEGQLHALQLKDYKDEVASREKAKKILSEAGPIDSQEKVDQLTDKLRKEVGYESAMKFHQAANQAKSTDLELEEKKTSLARAQIGTVLDLTTPLATHLQQLGWTDKDIGKPHPQMDAVVKAEAPQLAAQLKYRHPELGPHIDQMLQDPSKLTADGFMQMWMSSGQAKEQLARKNVQSEITRRGDETAHGKAEEGFRAREVAVKEKGASGGGFTEQMGTLMAALAERGVSLPTGFRSKAQQATLYRGLLERNPDKSPEEIANLIAKGQLEFGAQKKETTTAAAVAGRVEVAQNEIEQFVPLVREASAKVPRGKFVPLNKLMQAGEASISDPNLRALKIRINSVLNAYDMLAARGGTDMEKRREVRNLLLSSDSPEALESSLKSFELEAAAAHRAAIKATRVSELPEPEGTPPPAASGSQVVHWNDLK